MKFPTRSINISWNDLKEHYDQVVTPFNFLRAVINDVLFLSVNTTFPVSVANAIISHYHHYR